MTSLAAFRLQADILQTSYELIMIILCVGVSYSKTTHDFFNFIFVEVIIVELHSILLKICQ